MKISVAGDQGHLNEVIWDNFMRHRLWRGLSLCSGKRRLNELQIYRIWMLWVGTQTYHHVFTTASHSWGMMRCEITYFTVCCMCCTTLWCYWGTGTKRGRWAKSLKPQRRSFLWYDIARHGVVFTSGAVSKWAGECMRTCDWLMSCTYYSLQSPPISKPRRYLSANRARITVIYPMVGYHGTEIHWRETVWWSLQRLCYQLFAHSS